MTIQYLLYILAGLIGAAAYKYVDHRDSDREYQRWVKRNPVQASFELYMDQNPQLRFWQGLANWSEHHIFATPLKPIQVLTVLDFKDTWEWEGQHGKHEFSVVSLPEEEGEDLS